MALRIKRLNGNSTFAMLCANFFKLLCFLVFKKKISFLTFGF